MKRRRRGAQREPRVRKRRFIQLRTVRQNPGLRALKLLNRMKKSEELKYLDATVVSGNLASDANSVGLCNGIAQGTTEITRLGGKIMMKSIYVKYYTYSAAGEVTSWNTRVALVYDRRPAGVALTWANVFGEGSLYGMINIDPQYKGRFLVLWDDTKTITGENGGGGNDFVKFFIKKDLPVQFITGQAGATVAAIGKGSLYLMFYSLGNTVGNMNIDAKVRIRFTDF